MYFFCIFVFSQNILMRQAFTILLHQTLISDRCGWGFLSPDEYLEFWCFKYQYVDQASAKWMERWWNILIVPLNIVWFSFGGEGAPYPSLSQTGRCIMCPPHHIIRHCYKLYFLLYVLKSSAQGAETVYNATIVRQSRCLPPVLGIGLWPARPSGSISDFGRHHPSCGIEHLWINWIIGQVSCQLHFKVQIFVGFEFLQKSVHNGVLIKFMFLKTFMTVMDL